MKKVLLAAVPLVSILASSGAFGQETIEHVVVRNRLYEMAGRWEIGPSIGFTVVNELTDHTNFTLDAAYNFSESIAIEARFGYAYSHHTGLADQIASDVQANVVTSTTNPTAFPNLVDDLSNLWEMKVNAILGLRWSPLYGKISLMAELPVHFQAYLWLGGGGGMFHRESVVECTQLNPDSTCATFNTDDRATWIASAAFGMRFFVYHGGAIKLEARNYAFPDAYKVGIVRSTSQTGTPTGTAASSPGITNVVLFDIGYSFLF